MPRNRGRAMRRTAAAAAIATLCALIGATSASAASAPRSFFGVVPQTPLDAADAPAHGRRERRHAADHHHLAAPSIRAPRPATRTGRASTRRARGRAQRDRGSPVHLRHPELGRRRASTTRSCSRREVRALRAEVEGRRSTPGRPSSARPSTATGPAASSGRSTRRCPLTRSTAGRSGTSRTRRASTRRSPIRSATRSCSRPRRRRSTSRDSARRRDPRRDGRARRARTRRSRARSTWPSSTTSRARARASTASRRTRTARASTRSAGQIDLYRDVIKEAARQEVGMWVTEIGAGSAKRRQPAQRRREGPGQAAEEDLQVLPQAAQQAARAAGRLVQLAGLDAEHLLLVRDSGLLEPSGNAEAVARRVHQVHRRQGRLTAALSRCRRACGGPRWRCGSARTGSRPASPPGPAAPRRRRPRPSRCPRRSGTVSSLPNSATRSGVADQLGLGLDLDPAQLGVLGPGLDQQRRPRVALEVADLLRLGVGPDPDLAVADDEPHRHRVRPAARPDRGDDHDPLGVEQLACSASLSLIWSRRPAIARQSTSSPGRAGPRPRASPGAPASRSPRRGASARGRRPRPRRAAARASARRPPARRAAPARASSRCSTYSAIFAAGSSISGPWPGASSSRSSAPTRSQRAHVVGKRAAVGRRRHDRRAVAEDQVAAEADALGRRSRRGRTAWPGSGSRSNGASSGAGGAPSASTPSAVVGVASG